MIGDMILETVDLSRSFGGLKAVDNVSLSVKKNAIQSVIGPNGAGKTTLFNLITGLIPSAAGSVAFLGEDVTGLQPHVLAMKGLVRTFQRTSIFRTLPVVENVTLAIRSRKGLNRSLLVSPADEKAVVEEAHILLAKVGLRGREQVVSGQLSHGYQRALDIGIGLALAPKLILMDEPMAGMSRGDREHVAGLITTLRRDSDLTLVIVEHDIGMVMRLSDWITVMQNGRVIAHGTPAEIKDDVEVKKAYLHGSFAE